MDYRCLRRTVRGECYGVLSYCGTSDAPVKSMCVRSRSASAARFPFRKRCRRAQNKDLRETTLFLDYTAGDAIAGTAGGVGHEIVFPSVDDERCAAVVEERIGVITERDTIGDEGLIGVALLVHK